MNTSRIRRLAALSLAGAFTVGAGSAFAAAADSAAAAAPVYEQVDSIVMLRKPHSWQVVDDDTFVLWATPFDPYLVELKFRSPDLKFAEVIGVTQFGSRIYAKFDAVQVSGFRYPIDAIYKMTREEARSLTRGT